MKRAAIFAFFTMALVAPALAGELKAERDNVLSGLDAKRVVQRRSDCATGQAPAQRAKLAAAGFKTLGVGAYCVTVLTRLGRDGTLGYVRDPNSGAPKPAIAFDGGFVSGYRSREALPANAPAMAALLPVADRCLNQAETDTALCTAAGHMLGARSVRGELVPAD